jgi:L-ascorbate metabolism protein UlaG (beta-lactamase superfamily)
MKIKYINVSCFLITSDKGTRIITDPFFHLYIPDDPPPGGNPIRPGIEEYADVISLSHGHFDHSYIYAIKGVPRLYTGGAPVEIKGVKFSSVASWHDNYGQGGRGLNNNNCFEIDGIRIWHMGDYGQPELADEQVAQFGRTDILMTPWGNWAPRLIEQLKPRVVIPMHHTHAEQVKDLKGFLDLSNKTSELEYTMKTLPAEIQVIMLKASLESSM